MRIALVLVLLCGVAHAESERKDPTVAVALSVGVPVAGAVTVAAAPGALKLVGVAALLVGPSTGRWYAGEGGGATLTLRVFGGVTMGVGVVMLYGISTNDCDPDETCASTRPYEALALAGAGVIVATTIADVVLAKRAADRWNVAPTLVGGDAPGVTVSGRF
jgi:hypothetical protein